MFPILANTITADMGLIPGFALAGPAMGLPLSVLAAFLERPFYTLAGVRHRAIWYSLQANLVSLLIGFFATLFAALVDDALRLWGPNDPLFTVWPFVAVAVSVLVERTYLAARLRPEVVGWRWTIAGNVLSAAACVGVLVLVIWLRETFPELRALLAPYHSALTAVALVGSVGMFIASFALGRSQEGGAAAMQARQRETVPSDVRL